MLPQQRLVELLLGWLVLMFMFMFMFMIGASFSNSLGVFVLV